MFDLSGFRQTDWKSKLYQAELRAGIAIMLAGFECYLLYLLALGLTSHALPLSSHRLLSLLSVLLVFGFILYTVAVTIPHFMYGASRIVLSEDNIEFTYPHGRRQTLRWDDPKTSLRLLDYTDRSDWVLPGGLYRVERTPGRPIPGLHHRQTFLSAEAFHAILRFANDHGLKVKTYRPSGWSVPGSPVAHLIDGSRGNR